MANESPGQTVLHEWTHLDWIGQTVDAPGPDGVDTYGYTRTAELYDTTHVDNQGERWGGENVVKNADNYAVFASYHAYNQEPWAPPDGRAGFGCKDVWPRNPLDVAIFQPPKPAKVGLLRRSFESFRMFLELSLLRYVL